MSILDAVIQETSIVALDLETTGFLPGRDRIVEASIVSVNPDLGPPTVLFDSLIHPGRTVPAATTEAAQVHGIPPEALEGAPHLRDIAGHLVDALAGSVLIGHNAYFDLRFLQAALASQGIDLQVPFLCTMSLRSSLGLGRRTSLQETCAELRIPQQGAHTSRGDAQAVAGIFRYFQRCMARDGIHTFRDLATRLKNRFVASWRDTPLPHGIGHDLQRGRLQPRVQVAPESQILRPDVDYATALIEAVADCILTPEEYKHLQEIRQRQGLAEEQVRAIHASVFTWTLTNFASDGWVDDHERDYLQRVGACLRQLGWAPGD